MYNMSNSIQHTIFKMSIFMSVPEFLMILRIILFQLLQLNTSIIQNNLMFQYIKFDTNLFACVLYLTVFIKKSLYPFMLKSGPYFPKKNLIIYFNDILSKMMKNAFYFILKALLFSRYLNFCLDFLGMLRKRLDQKDKFNFENYDATAWLTINCNTHIAQYLTN